MADESYTLEIQARRISGYTKESWLYLFCSTLHSIN
jgi:hypothetical protein